MMTVAQAKKRNFLLYSVAIIYVLSEAIILLYSWLSGIHEFDMSLTVSLYIGLHYKTSVFYFFCALLICLFLAIYVATTQAKVGQKILYYLIFLCVFGCALFPCSHQRSPLTTDIHDMISYALALLVAASFILMACFAQNKRQRIYGICCTVYAAAFLGCFILDVDAFENTILIWENLLIVLLFFEVALEIPKAEASDNYDETAGF